MQMVTPEKKKNRGRGLIEGSSGQPEDDEWKESQFKFLAEKLPYTDCS